MLPCDLSTEEVFTELRCPSAPVDILIASLVFDVVCVDACQLEARTATNIDHFFICIRSLYLTVFHKGDDEKGLEMAEARGSYVSAGR